MDKEEMNEEWGSRAQKTADDSCDLRPLMMALRSALRPLRVIVCGPRDRALPMTWLNFTLLWAPVQASTV